VLKIEQITVDAFDPRALGSWWAEALSWVVIFEDDREVEIRPELNTTPGILFITCPDSKVAKNRLHLDLRPDDQEHEVNRLLALGARRVDIGQQPSVPWVVLADPEGNEFCVLGNAAGGS
jgi:hypothetical protein